MFEIFLNCSPPWFFPLEVTLLKKWIINSPFPSRFHILSQKTKYYNISEAALDIGKVGTSHRGTDIYQEHVKMLKVSISLYTHRSYNTVSWTWPGTNIFFSNFHKGNTKKKKFNYKQYLLWREKNTYTVNYKKQNNTINSIWQLGYVPII